MKNLIKRILPAVVLEGLQQYKGQQQTLRQLTELCQGCVPKLLFDNFFLQLASDNPHVVNFARYYLGYNYRIFRAPLLRVTGLSRYLPQQEFDSIIHLHNTTIAASQRILCVSRMAIFPLQDGADSTAAFLMKSIGPKGRNMLRKAQKNGYCVKPIEYDENLDAIFAINTSKRERQGRPMDAVYRCYPQKRSGALHRLGIEYNSFGCFKAETGQLVAYAGFYRFGQLFRIDKVLGHGEHLWYGVMNLLFAESFRLLAASYPNSYVNYLTMNTLGSFKMRLGFEPYNLLYLLPDKDIPKHSANVLLREVCRSRTADWRGDWVARYLEQFSAETD